MTDRDNQAQTMINVVCANGKFFICFHYDNYCPSSALGVTTMTGTTMTTPSPSWYAMTTPDA